MTDRIDFNSDFTADEKETISKELTLEPFGFFSQKAAMEEAEFLDFVETKETIADFIHASENHWAESSEPIEQNNSCAFATVQVKKGDTRQAVLVVDLGSKRVVITQ